MVNNTKFYFKRGHILFLMILLSGLVDFVSAEESFKKINENKIEAMIKRAQPLIEMITGRQFTEKITFELVKREVVRDVLDEELLPIYKNLLKGADDDTIARQVETASLIASQTLLGKYSPVTKRFYIVPDNVQSHIERFEIRDEDSQDFIFLVIAYAMVGALDDQHFDLQNKSNSMENADAMQAVRSLTEGHSVYVINRITERLNLSETARDLSIKSAAGLTDESDPVQKQNFQGIYIKGAEFVEAIIDKKGLSGITQAFASPPTSMRQIMNPEEYLGPSTARVFNCAELIKKVAEKLPIRGMQSQSVPLGPMNLGAVLASQGIPEKEANSAAADCINGAAITAVKQTSKPCMVVATVLNFTNSNAAANYLGLIRKIEESTKDQLGAMLNASYSVVKEDDLKLDGFDTVRYQHVETKIDENITKQLSADGIINNLYVAIAFVNPEKDQTPKSLSDILLFLNNERLNML